MESTWSKSTSPLPSTPEPQRSSGLFNDLSAELRVLILTAAFGDRTIHISCYDATPPHPLQRPWPKKTSEHSNSSTQLCSTVCRRNFQLPGAAMSPGRKVVADDCCTATYPTDEEKKAEFWTEKRLVELHLGALEWLLSCRQAYIEGIDVLFMTNTFHIDRPALAASLASFFPPQHLVRIRAMEFKLDWREARMQGDFEAYDQRLKTILGNVPDQLHNVTHLSIAFQDHLWPDPNARPAPSHKDFEPWLEAKVLQPLDRMIKNMAHLKVCDVYFTSSVHSVLRKGKDWKRMRNGDFRASFWRAVEGSADGKKGFWICEGRNDSPVMCTMMPPARQGGEHNE